MHINGVLERSSNDKWGVLSVLSCSRIFIFVLHFKYYDMVLTGYEVLVCYI